MAQAKRGRPPKVRGASPTEMFLARNANQMAETSEDFQQGGDTAVIGRSGPVLLTMYKPTTYGYKPVMVPSSNLSWVVTQGYLDRCPSCGGHCGVDINACPGRPKLMYRVCPVATCRKKFYDIPASAPDAVGPEAGDPNLIKDDAYMESTPELRTKAALDAHMFAYHPSESPALAPKNPRNPLEGPPPGRIAGVS